MSAIPWGSVWDMTTDPKLKPLDLGASGRQFAENLKRIRALRGASLRELSQQLKEVRLSADAINKIEKQQRRATVDELVALAVALRVNPSALLLPRTVHGDAEITGRGTVPAERAWKWADGKRPLDVPPDDDGSAVLDFRLHARPEGARSVELSVAEIRAAYRAGQFDDYPPEIRKSLGARAASQPGDGWNPETGEVRFAEDDQEEDKT